MSGSQIDRQCACRWSRRHLDRRQPYPRRSGDRPPDRPGGLSGGS